jgi:hypothetical protein
VNPKKHRFEVAFLLHFIGRLARKPRPAGSTANRVAESFILSHLERTNKFEIETQAFKFKQYIPEKYSFEIERQRQSCLPVLCSANSSRNGVSGILCHNGPRKDLHGKLVLAPITRQHESLEVESIAERGASAAIVFQLDGPIIASRAKYPSASIPCISVSSECGQRLWKSTARKNITARIVVRAKTQTSTGRNIIVIPRANESRALFVAHRDSRIFSPGAIDNASGCGLVLLSAQMSRKPRHSLLLTDAEEYGLLGAKSFASAGRLASNTQVINFDSVGAGRLGLVTESRAGRLSAKLNSRITQIGKVAGVRLQRIRTVRGSDSDVFMERGLDASWVKAYPSPTATTPDDTLAYVDGRILRQAASLLRSLVEQLEMPRGLGG